MCDIVSYLLGKKAGGGGGGGSDLDWTAIGYTKRPQAIDDGYDYALQIKNNWNPLGPNFGYDYKLVFFPLVDMSSRTAMPNYFQYCYSLISIPQIDTSNVTNMSGAFRYCYSLKTIPLLNTSNVTNISGMFQNCYSLISIPQIDTSNVTNISAMFSYCESLETVPILNTSKVTDMSGFFRNCKSLLDESLNNILQMCINATSYTGTKTLAQLGFSSDNYSVARIQALSNYQDFIDAGWTIGY